MADEQLCQVDVKTRSVCFGGQNFTIPEMVFSKARESTCFDCPAKEERCDKGDACPALVIHASELFLQTVGYERF